VAGRSDGRLLASGVMARRRPALSLALGFAASSLFAGCTLLIDFEEAPSATEAGLAFDGATAVRPDVQVEPTADGAVVDAGADVRDASDPNACKGKVDGKYCPGNQIVWAGNKDDLITCKAQVVSVRFCATGSGCIPMANGFPDQCDDCAKKTVNGKYCGRDFGWETKNAERLVTCQNGSVIDISAAACANGCLSNGAASACK
jgi:hypothetical protein